MNRQQRRSAIKSNLKASKPKVIHLDAKVKKMAQIKEKAFYQSVIYSVIIGIVLASVLIFT